MVRAIDLASHSRDGDLPSGVQSSGRDETSQLPTTMGDVKISLARLVSEVRHNAESVAEASSHKNAPGHAGRRMNAARR